MKTILREFIREALVTEAVTTSKFNFTADPRNRDPKSRDAVQDFVNFLTDADSPFVKWMNSNVSLFSFGKSSDSDKTRSKDETSSSLVGFFRLLFSKDGLDDRERQFINRDDPAGSLRKSLLGGGLAGLLAAGFSAYSTFFPSSDGGKKDLPEKAAEDLGDFYSSLMNIIGTEDFIKELTYADKTSSFNDDWPTIQEYYQSLTDDLSTVTSYNEYFITFNRAFKNIIDDLILKKSSNNEDLIRSYQVFAYVTLVYYTAKDYLPSAVLLDTKHYGELNTEQQQQLVNFLQKIEIQIKDSKTFKEAENTYKKLGLLN